MTIDGAILTVDSEGDKFQCNTSYFDASYGNSNECRKSHL